MKIILDLCLKDLDLISQGLQKLSLDNDSEIISLKKSFENKQIPEEEYISRHKVLERRSNKLNNLILSLWK